MNDLRTFSPRNTTEIKPVRQADFLKKGSRIAVVGAGSFGGWTAFHLQKMGFNTTLIDAFGPGNSRSSSGDESRVSRSTYGANEVYFDLNVASQKLWKFYEKAWSKPLFDPTGIVWFCYAKDNPMIDDSLIFMEKHQLPHQIFNRNEAAEKWPQIHLDDLDHLFFDPSGGVLRARESCQAVVENFVKNGGEFIQKAVKPGPIENGRLTQIQLSDGQKLEADLFLFACGSWLGKLFPDEMGHLIQPTKQEVFYFGMPDFLSKTMENLPIWVDLDGRDFYYGIPKNGHRGFKIGVDIRGAAFNPTTDDHLPNPETLQKARAFLAHRFPILADAPLLENRVCPYENSPDGNFLLDFHSSASNLWWLGGGSGHGFKHGPALGELAADVLTGRQPLHPLFAIR